jgi:hypothetical protein
MFVIAVKYAEEKKIPVNNLQVLNLPGVNSGV